jgi:hypothetical protein
VFVVVRGYWGVDGAGKGGRNGRRKVRGVVPAMWE